MILYGQYDSPFVRRVAVALHHYGLAFERRILSTFTDFEDVTERCEALPAIQAAPFPEA